MRGLRQCSELVRVLYIFTTVSSSFDAEAPYPFCHMPVYCMEYRKYPSLGRYFFLLYTADLIKFVLIRDLHPDIWFLLTGSNLSSPGTECINDVATWMRSNRLQLNAAKTEVLWCASGRRQGQLPDASFTVGCDTVKPVRCVRCRNNTAPEYLARDRPTLGH